MATTVRTIEITANSIDELRDKAAQRNVILQPGSAGRLTVFAPRLGGLCAVPLGNLLETPLVGQQIAQHLLNSGAVVTAHDGLGSGSWKCDGFVDWAIPQVTAQQGQVSHMAPIALIAVVGALSVALVALGWAISQFRLLVDAIVENFGATTGGAIFLVAGVLGVLGMARLAGGRR